MGPGTGGGIVSPLAAAVQGPPQSSDGWDRMKVVSRAPIALQPSPQAPPQQQAPQGPQFSQEGAGLIAAGVPAEMVARGELLSRATGAPLAQTLGAIKHQAPIAASPGGWSPTGKTEQRQGFWSPDAVEAQRERETGAIAAGTVAGEEAAKARIAAARAQAAELAKDAGTSEEEIDAWEKSLSAQQKSVIEDLQGIAEQRVDPGKLFRDRGVVGSALSMLGDAISTYAEFRAGRPLSERLRQDIDRDVQLQAEEISRKGEERRNELAVLRDQFGDLEQAKTALRAKQEAALAMRLSVLANEAEEPAVKAGLEADAAKMWADMQGRMEALSQGTRSESQSSAYRQATAGRAGGYYVDPEEAAKLIPGGAMDPKEARASVTALSDKRQPADSVLMTIDQIAAENALPRDPMTGELMPSPDGISGFGFVDAKLPDGVTPEQGLKNRQRATSLVMAKVQSAFGAANEKQVEMIEQQLLGAKTERDFLIALNEAERQARNEAAQRNAGQPRQVVQAYESQLASERARIREQYIQRAKVGAQGPEARR